MTLKALFFETRPQFLILSVILAFLGTCIAWYDGFLHFGHAALAFLGLLLTHVSVNTLNDYFDYRSGIDLAVIRTPFSGGSGMLPSKALSPKQVLWIGIISLLLAIPIGIYFIVVSGWLLLPLLLVAVACVILYTPFILKIPYPEWAAGLGLGFLPVMGMYFALTGNYTWPLVIASVPSGILVHNLLFLNEFPDVKADKVGNRKTTPIVMGKANAAKIYIALTILVYLWVIGAVIAGVMPIYTLIALLTLPLAVKAIRGSMQYEDMGKLVPAMANNVLVILLTQFLLSVGYILAAVL